ncbi:zf-HC2 domain-containing protein [Burkholderia sp. Ac-20345]|uniref:zf-HC2 domain-containing protein n=1 Tax=Burkholderia sp. Ac-20345 TaxID=2703891 RepID=UPI00197B758C|nr:zf-HC2 domain-containing protein [Burkholderia sp. Ac-20345]MBN3782143.1 zf-HC2 domain-containing protein [Burkholderia sp. Ac-20345]
MDHSAHKDLTHLHAWELLPWVVNGTASVSARAQVDEHLRHCGACREELAYQKRLHAALNAGADAAGPNVDVGLADLSRRLDAPRAVPRSRLAALCYGLAALLVLETGSLAIFGAQMNDSRSATYRTLSQREGAQERATIRLVVDAAMPIGRLQALLVPLGLQILAGPGENGVYSLGPTSPAVSERGGKVDVNRQIGALRAASDVRFVEPIIAVSNGP